MMDFKEFVNEIAEKIKDFLPDSLKDALVDVREVTKNNGVKFTGLTIHNDDSKVYPTIYLEQFYKEYADNGIDLNTIMQMIVKVRVEHDVTKKLDVEKFRNFDYVRDRITCKLVNREHNSEFLETRPYTPIEDLAVVYLVDIEDFGAGRASTAITYRMMEEYGISAEELHSIAMDNLSKSDISFMGMYDMLKKINPGLCEAAEDEIKSSPMYVLTIEDCPFGAAAVMDAATMKNIAEKIGGDFYVIPSSVNEVIIVPMIKDTNSNLFNEMIQEVNATQVEEQDRLSDHVYMYDAAAHMLLTPEHYDERHLEKNEEHDIVADITSVKDEVPKDFPSVMDKLSEKAAEVVQREASREAPVRTKDVPVKA